MDYLLIYQVAEARRSDWLAILTDEQVMSYWDGRRAEVTRRVLTGEPVNDEDWRLLQDLMRDELARRPLQDLEVQGLRPCYAVARMRCELHGIDSPQSYLIRLVMSELGYKRDGSRWVPPAAS